LRFALFPLEKWHPFCVPSVIELGKFNGPAAADPAAAHLDVGALDRRPGDAVRPLLLPRIVDMGRKGLVERFAVIS